MDYYKITKEELGKNAKIPLVKVGDSGEVGYEMALEMIHEIEKNNVANKKTVFICPVGPVIQYPIFVRHVIEKQISLKQCWFINMDEYLNDDGTYIDMSHPKSFRAYMEREVYGKIPEELVVPKNQRIFPDPKDVSVIPKLIEELGGVDVTFGGIGINGHLAFNEPQPNLSIEEFSKLETRVLDISIETLTINGAGDFGGALEDIPKKCVTVGMKEILSAKKIRLAVCRDWHSGVVRRAAYGEVTSAFPVTICQNHADTKIYLNEKIAELPY